MAGKIKKQNIEKLRLYLEKQKKDANTKPSNTRPKNNGSKS